MSMAANTPVTPAPVLSIEQSSEEKNSDFAQQLHDELLQEGDTESPSLEDTPVAVSPKKASAVPSDKQVSADTVLELLRAGDLTALAKELGQDPKDFRVKNSQFIKLRQQEKHTKSKLSQEKQQIEQERNTLRQQRQNLEVTQAKIFQAVKHIENEDWPAFIHEATGMDFDEFQKRVIQNSLDPSAKEIRRLRAEQAQLRQEREEEARKLQEQQLTAQQAQARANYMGQLKAELLEDDELGLDEFVDHPNMPGFIDAVFEEQKKSYNGEEYISARKAAQRVIKTLLSNFNTWSPFVSKYGSGSTDTPKGRSTEQGVRATSTAARSKSVSRSQGGSPPDVRKMSQQEKIAHFAAQMRSERL